MINRPVGWFVAILLLSAPFLIFARANAQDFSWLSAGAPTLSSPENIPVGQTAHDTLTGYGNTDCNSTKFITRPARISPLQSEQSHTACAVTTEYGNVDPSGYLLLNGTKVAGRLKTSVGTDSLILPIPHSKKAIVLLNNANGTRVQFYENIATSFSAVDINTNGSVAYRLPVQPTRTLEDTDGHDFFIKPETISFSANGKWMVVDSAFVATLRVNLETYEVVPFQSPYTYNLGLNPLPHTAISDDGRYAVSTSNSLDFRLTDISTCAVVPEHITGPVGCQNKSLQQGLTQQISGFKRALQPRFVNNDLMIFYARYDSAPGVKTLAKFRLAPPGQVIKNQDYLALGDSFASGEGAYDYFSETDTAENMCHLSRSSYPYLIGQALQLNSYNSVACSGAKIDNIFEYTQRSSIPDPNTLGNLLPGYKKQIDYVRQLNPNVITVGIAGNDIGFGDLIKNCVDYSVSASTCYKSYEDRLELAQLINRQFEPLSNLYKKLKADTATNSKVYVHGYPKVLQNDGDCAVNVRLNNDEIKFSNLFIAYLNSVIEAGAKNAGVKYVDVTDAFAGHKMCETASRNSAINGVTAGDDGPFGFGPIGNEGFHPNQLGHQLFKQTIIEQTNNFTLSLPSPDGSTQAPTIDDSLPLLQAPKQNRTTRNLAVANNMVGDSMAMSTSEKLLLSGSEFALKTHSNYTVEVHSVSQTIGSYTTNGLGDLNADILIPSNLEPGFHQIHVLGENIQNEPIDIYKTVYVMASTYDFDDDGQANEIDSCLIVPNTNLDLDKDNIDDACDEEIIVPTDESNDAEPPSPTPGTNDNGGNTHQEPIVDETPVVAAPDIYDQPGDVGENNQEPVINDEPEVNFVEGPNLNTNTGISSRVASDSESLKPENLTLETQQKEPEIGSSAKKSARKSDAGTESAVLGDVITSEFLRKKSSIQLLCTLLLVLIGSFVVIYWHKRKHL